jgi:hypothetical protein
MWQAITTRCFTGKQKSDNQAALTSADFGKFHVLEHFPDLGGAQSFHRFSVGDNDDKLRKSPSLINHPQFALRDERPVASIPP